MSISWLLLNICTYPWSIFKTGKLTLKQDFSCSRLYERLDTWLRGQDSIQFFQRTCVQFSSPKLDSSTITYKSNFIRDPIPLWTKAITKNNLEGKRVSSIYFQTTHHYLGKPRQDQAGAEFGRMLPTDLLSILTFSCLSFSQFILCVCMLCLHVYMWEIGTQRHQLPQEVAVSHHVNVENWIPGFWRATRILDPWIGFSTPQLPFLYLLGLPAKG